MSEGARAGRARSSEGKATHQSTLVVPLVLAIIRDGVPANTVIPEAYEHAGKHAGVFLVLGFAVCVWVIVLEHSWNG